MSEVEKGCSFLPVILLNCEMRVKFSYSSIHLSCMQPFHTHQYFTQIFFFGMNRIETCILHNKCYEAVRKCYIRNKLLIPLLLSFQPVKQRGEEQANKNKVNRLIELFITINANLVNDILRRSGLFLSGNKVPKRRSVFGHSFGSFVKNLKSICRIFLFNV